MEKKKNTVNLTERKVKNSEIKRQVKDEDKDN